MTATILFCAIFLAISALYFFIILLIGIGTCRLKNSTHSPTRPLTNLPARHLASVIIPVRNEESTIVNCLGDLLLQDYPADRFEVVVVNDHSSDRTEENVLRFARLHPALQLRLVNLPDDGSDQAFKKRSIRAGVEATTGEIIVTTDADTRMNPGWLSAIADFYQQYHPEMIISPVSFRDVNTFFGKLQSLEFAGLMTATAGSCKMGFPLMCNGANLAFTRRAYLETLGSEEDLRYPSGDDLFLMMKIRKKFGPSSIRYLFAAEAIVSTWAKSTPGEFFSQRLRWVSKSRGYTDPVVMAVSVITWLFNFLLLSALIAGIFNSRLCILSLLILGIKMILEFPSVYRILDLSGQRKLMMFYPFVQVLNLVYVFLIGILGNILSYQWKGRKVSPLRRNSPG